MLNALLGLDEWKIDNPTEWEPFWMVRQRMAFDVCTGNSFACSTLRLSTTCTFWHTSATCKVAQSGESMKWVLLVYAIERVVLYLYKSNLLRLHTRLQTY